jgi:RES domain-containing protein
VLAWRICRAAHRELEGEGARLHGGRWNSEGVSAVYASSTLALSVLEYLVHVDIEDVPDDLVAMALEIPDDAGERIVAVSDLPADWNQVPDHPACAEIGDAWAAEGTALLLRVPSAVVPEESNLLINPHHPRAGDVVVASVRPFAFDSRLLRQPHGAVQRVVPVKRVQRPAGPPRVAARAARRRYIGAHGPR